jgi:hypothetical protein
LSVGIIGGANWVIAHAGTTTLALIGDAERTAKLFHATVEELDPDVAMVGVGVAQLVEFFNGTRIRPPSQARSARGVTDYLGNYHRRGRPYPSRPVRSLAR